MRGSCAVCENVASETPICVFHLTDSASLAELDGFMESAGASAERRAAFHAHLAQFNACAASMLHEGYQTVSTASPCYDPSLLQDMWSAAHPDFIGYNCRITAFSLMGDAISIADAENPNVANLFMDQQSLQEDTSAMLSDADLPRFLALFLCTLSPCFSILAPYQAVHFESRAELKAYLMTVYDVEWGQPTARPFILENGRIL